MISQYIIISTPDREINEGYFGHNCDGCGHTFLGFPPSGLRYDAVGVFKSGDWDNLTLCETCYVEAVS